MKDFMIFQQIAVYQPQKPWNQQFVQGQQPDPYGTQQQQQQQPMMNGPSGPYGPQGQQYGPMGQQPQQGGGMYPQQQQQPPPVQHQQPKQESSEKEEKKESEAKQALILSETKQGQTEVKLEVAKLSSKLEEISSKVSACTNVIIVQLLMYIHNMQPIVELRDVNFSC